jgi:hypothetical protein
VSPPERKPRSELTPLAVLLDLVGVLIDVDFERALQVWHMSAQELAENTLTAAADAKLQGISGRGSKATQSFNAFSDLAYQ